MQRSCVVADVNIVAVDNKDSHDIVGVALHPCGNLLELGLKRSCVEKIASGVATVDCVVHQMCFSLYHADAVIELSGDPECLIATSIAWDNKGRVVGADLGDVAVFTVAELSVAIARLRIGWGSSCACRRAGR